MVARLSFLLENLLAEMDSVAKYGQTMTVNHGHNLDDILFQYGVKSKTKPCTGYPMSWNSSDKSANKPSRLLAMDILPII